MNEIKSKAIDLAANYYANWKHAEAEHNRTETLEYYCKYDAARQMASIIGIDASEIEAIAWNKYGEYIGKTYEANNTTI